MQHRTLAAVMGVLTVSAAIGGGCTGDDTPAPSQAGFDASLNLDAATSADGVTSADVGSPDTGASDAGAADDAASDAALDAGADADADADVGADADAGPPVVVLYAHIRQNLYRVDPDTAAMTLIGPTGQSDVRLAWDGVRGELRGIVDALTAPKVATLDRCTGATVVGPLAQKTLDGGADGGLLKRIECFAAQPGTGAFYGSGDWDNSASSLSEALVALQMDAGTASRIGGNIQTLQDDSDNCTFRDQALYFIDVMATTPTTGSTGLYVWNLEDAGTTLVATTSPKFTRIGYEATRDTFYAFDSVLHQLVRVQLDGGSTVVGDLSLAADAAQADMDSVIAAPLPAACP